MPRTVGNYNKSYQLLQEVSPDGRSGAMFVFSYEGMDDSEGQKLAGKFDWGAMKSKLQ